MFALTPPVKKHTLGIDLTYPLLSQARYEQNSGELIYRYYLSDRLFIHESAGFSQFNWVTTGNPLPQITKLNGYFNRAGLHFQFYKPYWFKRSQFKKTPTNENASIGLNFLTGIYNYQLRYNTYGQLLLPYQVNEKGKLAYAGIEVQMSLKLFNINNFQLNYMMRYGLLKTSKTVRDFDKIAALPGTGINNDPAEYGEVLGLYALYRF
jgi:hypothetical protein